MTSPDHPHICYVGTSFRFETDFRFAHKQCPGLAARGFTVSYFTQCADADHPFTHAGVTIHPFRKPRTKWGQLMLPFRLLRRLVHLKCDAYHLGNTELLPIAFLLKALTRRRVILDCREDFVEFVRIKPYLKGPVRSVAVAATRRMMLAACRRMDGLLFGDEGVADLYPQIPPSRKLMVHHFPLKSLFPENRVPFRERTYDVVYLGTMSATGGIFVMLEAVAILKRRIPGLRVMLIGEPVPYIKEAFDRFVKDHGLEEGIHVTGKIPYPDVPALLEQARVGLIGLRDLPKFHRQSATKLFEYMAKGVPCVSVDLPPERRFMTHGQEGLFVPPENPAAMADAVERLLTDPQLGETMARQGRETFVRKQYYAEKELDRLADFYRKLFS